MMDEKAKAARREYRRRWAKMNPDKIRAQQERYWRKKAAEADSKAAEQQNNEKQ